MWTQHKNNDHKNGIIIIIAAIDILFVNENKKLGTMLFNQRAPVPISIRCTQLHVENNNVHN